jgi:hypothetical protein
MFAHWVFAHWVFAHSVFTQLGVPRFDRTRTTIPAALRAQPSNRPDRGTPQAPQAGQAPQDGLAAAAARTACPHAALAAADHATDIGEQSHLFRICFASRRRGQLALVSPRRLRYNSARHEEMRRFPAHRRGG